MQLATRKAFTALVKDAALFCALAEGDEEWGSNPPAPTTNETDVLEEHGRKKVLYKEYVTPDEDGDIVGASGAKYSLSQTPTNYLYVKVTFEPDELPEITFREIGWFWGGTTDPELPPGQLVFIPEEVVTKGTILAVSRRAPVVRNPETRYTFHNVINF